MVTGVELLSALFPVQPLFVGAVLAVHEPVAISCVVQVRPQLPFQSMSSLPFLPGRRLLHWRSTTADFWATKLNGPAAVEQLLVCPSFDPSGSMPVGSGGSSAHSLNHTLLPGEMPPSAPQMYGLTA